VSKVLAIDCFGDAIIEIPDELFEELDWRVGDKLDYEINKDKSVIVKNLTKEERNATNK
jgi:bifunctional DNA-binding transcriptional regulator/antitoxin component of YhaV-PrlF toxin-antitoxin module